MTQEQIQVKSNVKAQHEHTVQGSVSSNPVITDLARIHREAFERLQRMPGEPDYITPEEGFALIQLCAEYKVDWSVGLRFRDGIDEEWDEMSVWQEGPDRRKREVPVKIRLVYDDQFMGQHDDQGAYVPDFTFLWATQLIGRLTAVVRGELLVALERSAA